jgi:hypothetical protein
VVVPQALFGRLFGGAAKMAPGKNVEEAKAELLQFISSLKRGVDATDSDKQQVDEMAQVLTAVNCYMFSSTSTHVYVPADVVWVKAVYLLQYQAFCRRTGA